MPEAVLAGVPVTTQAAAQAGARAGILLLPRGSARASARAVTLLAAALAALGMAMIVSVSSGPETPASDPYRLVRRQTVALIGAALAGMACARLDYRALARRSWWVMGALWAALVVVLAMPEQLGARRWIPIAGVGQFQPSEFAKLGVIVWAAAFAARKGDAIRSFWKGFLPGVGFVALTSALVMAEPDNGTAIFLAVVGGAVLLVNGLRLLHTLPLLAAGIPAAVVWMSSLHGYVDQRLRSFNDDFSGKIEQIQQALVAIGSGGLFGLGFGSGRAHLGHVPKIYNDFIMAAIAEQLGFVGCALVLAAFCLLFLHGLRIAALAADRVGFSIAFGVSFMIALQAAINVAVATDTAPPKGINLPFVSCGGSSIVCLGAALGLLHSVARRAEPMEGAAS